MILQIFIIFIIFISVLFFCLSNYFSLEYWSYFSLTLKKKKKQKAPVDPQQKMSNTTFTAWIIHQVIHSSSFYLSVYQHMCKKHR